jgi:hypothetical protein
MVDQSPLRYTEEESFNKLSNTTIFEIAPSAARTSTFTGTANTLPGCIGAEFLVDITAITATPSVQMSIEAFDATSGKWVSMGAWATSFSSVSSQIFRWLPGLTSAGRMINGILPRTWRLVATHADGDSITYSITCMPIFGGF